MLKIRLLIITIFLGFTLVNAQPLVKVTGTVSDPSNNPLQFVTITVLGQQASTLTAADGTYTIYAKNHLFYFKV